MQSATNTGTYAAQYDGNGNVIGLVYTVDGSVSAEYECGPFGELLRATGPMAGINSLRFSSKYSDDESGLLYYGYRYYKPSTGGWVSRDPIEEEGGAHLYAMVENNPESNVDALGLDVN